MRNGMCDFLSRLAQRRHSGHEKGRLPATASLEDSFFYRCNKTDVLVPRRGRPQDPGEASLGIQERTASGSKCLMLTPCQVNTGQLLILTSP